MATAREIRAERAREKYHATDPVERKAAAREKYRKHRKNPVFVEKLRERNRTLRAVGGADFSAAENGYKKDRRTTPETWLKDRLYGIKYRSEKRGIPFSISASDFGNLPTHCPVLGMVLTWGVAGDAAPSVDRLVPSLGYVPGNCFIISYRANRLKSDCTGPDELRRVADFLERALHDNRG